MFEPAAHPRVFAQEPGADFPRALAQGLRARLAEHPPEAMARVEVFVNTARMRSALTAALTAQGPGFLPRIRLITDLGPATDPAQPPVPALRRRLELAQLVRRLIQSDPTLAPKSAIFALADSLAQVLDEMQAEGVAPKALDRLDVSNHSEHWTRSLHFLRLILRFLDDTGAEQARQRRAVETLAARWRDAPPAHPVLVAGSTGSRGATALFMQAVARLPQGALVLPGFDFDMPAGVWDGLDDPLTAEDHPQHRFHALMRALDITPAQIRPWAGPCAPDPARNRLVSLALRPAPVTDRWLAEGPGLGDLLPAVAGLSLIEAPHPRLEALAIAHCLRQAVVDGKKAALITPDRLLARQVSAALDRWQIRPDDSAGMPLSLSPPGRLLRQCAALMQGETGAEALLALLKHPLAHAAQGRGPHLLRLRALELWLRRRVVPYPEAADLRRWAETEPEAAEWAGWIEGILTESAADPGEHPLEYWVTRHLALAVRLVAGAGGEDSAALWDTAAGAEARAVMDELLAEAGGGGVMAAHDYCALLETLFAPRAVRETVAAHPLVAIRGTLEARAQGFDLVVLGGLNEGVWPAAPAPDPWFNRRMRLDAGLLLPERQIGLSAHDFQQAVGAPRVVLSRALRNAEAETVPSRWLNRMCNLIAGLPAQNGPEAMKAMKARGREWLDRAAGFEADLTALPPEVAPRSPRPAPAPPAAARPRELPVTAISRLIRDPYAVYGEYVLRLRELDPLAARPDPRLRGTVLHRVLQAYVAEHPPGAPADSGRLLAVAETILADEVPWRASRIAWVARLARVADEFAGWNAAQPGQPVVTERGAALTLSDPPFRLTGRPDRIDRLPGGQVRIFDYKTGKPPTRPQQEHFDKQLILLAIMAEDGVFPALGPASVELAEFIGLGSEFKCESADLAAENLQAHRIRLSGLLRAYLDPAQGFTARRALKGDRDRSAYDQLSRLGEWDVTDPAETIIVGDHDA